MMLTRYARAHSGFMAQCVELSFHNKHVARWMRSSSSSSFTKQGELSIDPAYLAMQDLIVTTALAMDEWMREQSKAGGAAAAAGGASC